MTAKRIYLTPRDEARDPPSPNEAMATKTKTGKVFLVGAGPGDLGLVTLRAKERIEQADVIVYDHLANPEMLGWARAESELISAGKKAGEHSLRQQEINAIVERGGKSCPVEGGVHLFLVEAQRKQRQPLTRESKLKLCRESLLQSPDQPMQEFQ